jgi:hypothetical protein
VSGNPTDIAAQFDWAGGSHPTAPGERREPMHWHILDWLEFKDREWRERQVAHDKARLAKGRAQRAISRARRKAWTAGVSKIMAEVRRREAGLEMPEPPFFASDNPLDGERLWA